MPSSVTTFPAEPAHGFRGDTPSAVPPARPRGLVVTISREAGARGGTIARKVGELLGWQVFYQETLDYLAQDDTARSQFLADVPEGAKLWAANQFARLQREGKAPTEPDAVAMIELLLAVAGKGDAVIVGRGAGFLLPAATTVHVRVVAPLESRIVYFAQWLRMSRQEAAAEVHARDTRRSNFLNQLLGSDTADPTAYDAVVNAERLGIEGAAQFIGWAVRTKQMFAEITQDDAEAAVGIEELAGRQ